MLKLHQNESRHLVYKPFLLFNLFLAWCPRCLYITSSVSQPPFFPAALAQKGSDLSSVLWPWLRKYSRENTAQPAGCTFSPPHMKSRKCIIFATAEHKTATSQCSTIAFSFFLGNILPYSLLFLFVLVIIAAYGQKLEHLLIWNFSFR